MGSDYVRVGKYFLDDPLRSRKFAMVHLIKYYLICCTELRLSYLKFKNFIQVVVFFLLLKNVNIL